MTGHRQRLEKDGYTVVADVVSSSACTELVDALTDSGGVGSRTLLQRPRFRRLAASLRNHDDLESMLAAKVAVQCTLFHKTSAKNWGIRLHRDRVVPARGGGRWRSSGMKEQMAFVRPPPVFMRRLLAVRVSLDDAAEGDLEVLAGSHRDDRPLHRADAVPIPVPRGGALVMSPLLAHCSSRLRLRPARRVLHFLFAPSALPYSYQWYHSA